jgi:hypothetical protein
MRAKLCLRHYDPAGLRQVHEQAVRSNYYPRKIHRSQQWVIAANIIGMPHSSVARFAAEGLVSYGTTPGEPHFVQGGAPTASGHAKKAIAFGCVDLTRPDDRGEALEAIFASPGFWSEVKRRQNGKHIPAPKETVERSPEKSDGINQVCAAPADDRHPSDTVFCFTLGDAI